MKINRFHYKKSQFSKNTGASITIPGETYTIRELLIRHTNGLEPMVTKSPIWQENATHDDLDLQKTHSLDLTERDEIKQQQKSIIDSIHSQQNEKTKQLEQKVQEQAKNSLKNEEANQEQKKHSDKISD